MNYQSGKDSPPEQTVRKIRDILSSVGLLAYEAFWGEHVKYCYNLCLELDGFPAIGQNGKGVNRAYTLASAYAEMIERLQCNTLFRDSFGLMNEVSLVYPDAEIEDVFYTLQRLENFFVNMFGLDIDPIVEIIQKFKMNCVPYYHVNNKMNVNLPDFLINSIAGSNGLCAGNNASEAIVQGLSEIMERHVTKKSFGNEYTFPDIPIGDVSNTMLTDMIEDIEGKGYKLTIKDFTLGGVFPCIGVVIMDNKTMEYFINIGAHPVFDIALQRCITEAFQTKYMKTKMHPLIDLFGDKNLNYNMQFKFGAYTGSLELLESNKPGTVYRNAFMKSDSSNKEMLEFICNRLINLDFNIYIRDKSYLGFPTFQIYVNGMSEMGRSLEEIQNAYENDFQTIRYLLNLNHCSIQELQQLTEKIEELDKTFNEKGYSLEAKSYVLFKKCNVIFMPGTDFQELLQDIDYFLAILYHRLADYEKAYLHLEKYIDRQCGNLPGIKYFLCVLHFFKLKMQGKEDPQEIQGILESIYGTVAYEVVEDVSDPEKAFQYFDLPSCGECFRCSYSDGRCSYPSWKNYMQVFQDKINTYPIGQEKLVSLFEEISIPRRDHLQSADKEI
jgi:uncharacterized domain